MSRKKPIRKKKRDKAINKYNLGFYDGVLAGTNSLVVALQDVHGWTKEQTDLLAVEARRLLTAKAQPVGE